MKKPKLLGQELVKAGIISAKQLKSALQEQRRLKNETQERIQLGELILRLGLLDEKTLITFLEKHFGIPYARLRRREDVDIQAAQLIPEKMARNFRLLAVALDKENKKLTVAMSNPFDIVALDTIRAKTGYKIDVCFSQPKEIEESINRTYETESIQKSIHDFIDLKQAEEEKEKKDVTESFDRLKMEAVKTPVIEYVDQLLKNAVRDRASDIHIEPQEEKLNIRYRIDGILHDVFPPPKEMQSAIITRVKLLGNMDIAEQRLPQDGRFHFAYQNRSIDVRMASSRIVYGEKLVLRLLDKTSLLLDMKDLGMDSDNLEKFKAILKQAYGMVLVSGPTGSGKTTTLYSALNYINTPDKNIVTIEDPVEYQIKGINQIQTKHQIGLTFASGLRTVLRQDPDIIMIGEIRDLETLENAVKAALTGHLVLSTIHTNNAPSVIFRLMHMGLESYLITSSLSLVIAQRLVRKICNDCKEKTKLPESALKELEKKVGRDLGKMNFYKGRGCDECKKTGYKGRTALFEFFVISPKIKEMILSEQSENELKKIAHQEGMLDMFEVGLEKANKGITTIEEVMRVTVLENVA